MCVLSPSKWTPAEILSWVPDWLGLVGKPPGPLGPSPCPGEGLPLQLTCSAEELAKMILNESKLQMTRNQELNSEMCSAEAIEANCCLTLNQV